MTHHERLVRGAVQSEHVVHFFDDDQARIDVVSSYIADALGKNRSVLVVAQAKCWAAVSERLKQQGASVSPDARLVVLDAQMTLGGLMSGGCISRDLFNATIVPLVRSLATSSPQGVRVYGEMVDILAAEGDFAGACDLEVCWNDLAMQESFTLVCGYASAHFAAKGQRDMLAAICAAHTAVRTDSVDALGNWLVRSATEARAATTFSSAARAASSGLPSSARPQS